MKNLIVIVCDGDFPSAPEPLAILRCGAAGGVVIACDGAAESLVAHGVTPNYIVGDMDTLPPTKQEEFRSLIHRESEQDSNDLAKAFRFACRLIKTSFVQLQPLGSQLIDNKNDTQPTQAVSSPSFRPAPSPQTTDTQNITNKDGLLCKDFSVYLLGATGKREDHALGNISYLPQFQQQLNTLLSGTYAREHANANTSANTFADTTNNANIYANACAGVTASVSMVTDYGCFIPALDTVELRHPIGTRVSIFAFDPTLNIRSEGLEYQTDGVVLDFWWKATLNRFASDRMLLTFNHPAPALLYFPNAK